MLSACDELGPYEILEPIGTGGMGEAYRAQDTADFNKIIPPGVPPLRQLALFVGRVS
jgi:serine/threonine protein kinase